MHVIARNVTPPNHKLAGEHKGKVVLLNTGYLSQPHKLLKALTQR